VGACPSVQGGSKETPGMYSLDTEAIPCTDRDTGTRDILISLGAANENGLWVSDKTI
jgi:hypothetical protein